MPSEVFEQHVLLRVSGDKLRASLRIQPGISPDLVDPQAIDGLISARDILRGLIDEAAIQGVLERYSADPSETAEATIAQGTPPVHGKDGRFELEPSLAEEQNAQAEDTLESESAVDHYSHSAFVIVDAGQRLGKFVEPTEGTDGTDVFGNVIAAHRGRRADVRADQSVDSRPGGVVVARVPGQLHCTRVELRVNSELDIRENVDFSTGHVRFPGGVTVRGDVKDRFEIDCGKTLRVLGLVEAASLTARLDIELPVGIAGRERGRVAAGRDLIAGYLDAVEIDAGRDAVIEKEISNSMVRVGRTLRVASGAIRGGSIHCGVSCEASTIGAAGGNPTQIIVGPPAEVEDLSDEIGAMREALEAKCKAYRERIEPLASLAKPTPNQSDELCSLHLLESSTASMLLKLGEAFARLAGMPSNDADRTVTVGRMLHSGTEVFLGPYRLTARDDLRGPFSLVLRSGGEPMFVDVTSRREQPAADRMLVKIGRPEVIAHTRPWDDESPEQAAA